MPKLRTANIKGSTVSYNVLAVQMAVLKCRCYSWTTATRNKCWQAKVSVA